VLTRRGCVNLKNGAGAGHETPDSCFCSLPLGLRERAPGAAGGEGGPIDRYDVQALRSILAELEYTVVEEDVNSSGKPLMMVEAGETSFRIMGESCDGVGKEQVCRGIQLSTQFAPAGDTDFDEVMATANRTLRPAKLFWAGEMLAYERYLIMDGGVSRTNLKENIAVYVEILEALMGQLFKEE
jgi:hypothetical protein